MWSRRFSGGSGGVLHLAGSSLDNVIDQHHKSLDELTTRIAEDTIALISHRENVTLGELFGPIARGHGKVAETTRFASSHMRDGEVGGFERIVTQVAANFGCIIETECLSTRLDGGKAVSPYSLPVTTIFLPEDGTWRIVHRQADPTTSVRPWDSVVQK